MDEAVAPTIIPHTMAVVDLEPCMTPGFPWSTTAGLKETGAVWTLSRSKSTQARVFFGVVSALALCLDLAVTTFPGELGEPKFDWSTAGWR